MEPELGPRFAQALGATFVAIGFVLLAAGASPWFWAPIAAVAGLQALLALTGYCLGCRLYGLHWFLPELFDRVVLRLPVERGSDCGTRAPAEPRGVAPHRHAEPRALAP